MGIIIFFSYILFLGWGFTYLNTKHNIVVRFQDENNESLRSLINILSITSFLLFIFSPIWEEYLNFLGIYVRYMKNIIVIPLLFRWYISSKISEMLSIKKEELKNTKIELTFCYYCGSDLNRSNICPNCGKEIE